MVKKLLEYYDSHKRDLPWRKDKDPYHIWISEIMCQQTRVDTAIPYYLRFIKQLPDIPSLAKISEDELNKLWQGLGYYSRARNLHKAAKIITEQFNGIFPKKYEDVLSLPGIGEYAASAICSMAYDLPYAAIDGNFLRVFSRYYENPDDISKESCKRELREKLSPLLCYRSGDFNQAVMDVGATICLPNGKPLCDKCPLKKECLAFRNNSWEKYPYSSAKTKVTSFNYSVFIIQTKEMYVLRKRDSEGLLASLYEFPNTSKKIDAKELKERFPHSNIRKEKKRVHHFSHQTWNMTPYIIVADEYILKEGEFLATKDELSKVYSVPKAFSQFFDLL